MATETFYERRMKDLQGEKMQPSVASNPLLQRPLNSTPTGLADKPQKPEDEKDPLENVRKSPFYMNVERFQQEDPKFNPIMESFTNLAMGLKAQVDNGFMPRQIAEQRLHQFIADHRKGYDKPLKQDQLSDGVSLPQSPQDSPQASTGALMGAQQGLVDGQDLPIPEAPITNGGQ